VMVSLDHVIYFHEVQTLKYKLIYRKWKSTIGYCLNLWVPGQGIPGVWIWVIFIPGTGSMLPLACRKVY
jgi:hypothetical protein